MPDGLIEIGPADRSEIGSLARLLDQLGYRAQEKRLAEAVARAAEDSSFEVIAARRDGIVVGLMSLIRFEYFPTGERICRITALVVDRACRSSGIGTRLIDHARDSGSGDRLRRSGDNDLAPENRDPPLLRKIGLHQNIFPIFPIPGF